MRRQALSLCLCLLLLLVLCLGSVPFASHLPVARAQSPVCDSLEVVFLVDQSGSMPGSSKHPVPNDPQGLRFYGPLRVLRWMGQDAVDTTALRLPSRPAIKYQAALVDFGDEATIRLPWTSIAPATGDDWQDLAGTLEATLAPYGGSKGYTNLERALRKARDLFAQRATPRDGCPRRAILLLTDGRPDLLADDFTVQGHMEQVKALVQGELAQMGVELWVTAINDSQDNYWPAMEPLWKRILPPDKPGEPPHALLVNSQDEIGDRFMQLMAQLTGRDFTPVKIGPRCVAPYLQAIVFTFYKREIGEHLQISDPLGPITAARQDIGVQVTGYDEPIETLRIERPIPGRWVISTSAPRSDVIIDVDKVPPVARLVEPAGRAGLQYVETPVVIQFTDSQGRALPEYNDPLFALTVEAQVEVGGKAQPLVLTPLSEHRYAGSFVPLSPGENRVMISAVSRGPKEVEPPDGGECNWEALQVLGTRQVGTINVAPLAVRQLGAAGGDCPLQVGDQLRVGYQVQAADDGRPALLSLPVDWEGFLEAAGQRSALTYQGPEAATGIYTATVALETAGPQRLVTNVTVRLPDGTKAPLANLEQQFNVVASTGVSAEIRLLQAATRPLDALHLSPAAPGEQVARDPFWRWLPVILEVRLVGEDGAAVDPSQVLRTGAGVPIKLTLTRVGDVRWRDVPLQASDVPGLYRAQVAGLGLGSYTVRAQLADGVTAACGSRFDPGAPVTLKRVENPWIVLQLALATAVLVALLVRLLWILCSRRNPCQGHIEVIDLKKPVGNNRVNHWYWELQGRNYWRLRGKDVEGLAELAIQEIQVRSTRKRCGRDPYEGRRIEVRVLLESAKGTPLPPLTQLLAPQERWEPPLLPGYAIRYVIQDQGPSSGPSQT